MEATLLLCPALVLQLVAWSLVRARAFLQGMQVLAPEIALLYPGMSVLLLVWLQLEAPEAF